MSERKSDTHIDRKLFKRADIYLITGLLLVAILFFLLRVASEGGGECTVSLEGRVIKTVSLSKNQRFVLPERPNIVFEVKDGAIAFISSDCPDKICVRTGFISYGGQSAACLPNRLMIQIARAAEDADSVAH